MKEQSFSTKEVVQLTGLTKDALRFYEKIGVIKAIPRDPNGYRKYRQSDVDWLTMVTQLKQTGIPIKDFIGEQDASLSKKLAYLKEYQLQIEEKIQELHSVQNYLNKKASYLEKLK